MVNIEGKLRAFSKDERERLLREVANATSVGYSIADKVRRFCSFHRSNITSVARSRFGANSNYLTMWMFEILLSAHNKFSDNSDVPIDAAYLSALLFLLDSTPSLSNRRSDVIKLVDGLTEQLEASTKDTDSGLLNDGNQFAYQNWDDEAKKVGTVIIFCPNPYSLYTSLVMHLCLAIDIPIVGVVSRKFTFDRMVFELKRDGFARLVKKIFRKLILRTDENSDKSAESLKKLHDVVVGVSPNVNNTCRLHGIPILEVNEFADSLGWLDEQAPDAAIFTGGGMISQSILDTFSQGVLNVHMGILPKYKGMDVVQAPILEGDSVGLTGHVMAAELDAGPIVQKFKISTLGYTSLGSLRNSLSAVMPILAIDSLLGMFSGRLNTLDQQPVGRQYYMMHPLLIKVTNNVLLNQCESVGPLDKNIVSSNITTLIEYSKDKRSN